REARLRARRARLQRWGARASSVEWETARDGGFAAPAATDARAVLRARRATPRSVSVARPVGPPDAESESKGSTIHEGPACRRRLRDPCVHVVRRTDPSAQRPGFARDSFEPGAR